MVKDYEYKILYHLGKDNVVIDALIRKADSAPIRGLCLRMTINSSLLDLIRMVQTERIKKEN